MESGVVSGEVGSLAWPETTQPAAMARKAADLGKNEFLQLLVAQLKYQNPLEPLDDKAFIAQLAQFSSLEELQGLHAALEQLLAEQRKTNELLGGREA